ncbi:ATP-grasp fold amidoligase family protein [Proteus mirabilis]|uniref:Gt3 n=1 Tax=Proteus mirabilis TaxID=584 RepID=A0A385JMT2_PROMI|nr:ATP-grasp fold amidoligase family protein [Proteus mirabilis]AXY99596.1 gt3 [Proteus mirabilis]KSW15463.1 hypothetical protein OL98_13805 [Proteus mirabilis]MBG2760468.1 hypothetical protein [Proteus mirabilis]MBG6012910.1 hypothetical protein [Proteus mirabilis]MBI6472687.1 hypothetical protein [Proteus mirabilis]
MNKPKHPLSLRVIYFLAKRNFLSFLSDSLYLKIIFYLHRGEKLDLQNPKTFSQKIQWLKVNIKDPQLHILVDKFLVRDYIKNKIGCDILIPMLGIYNNVDDINFNVLPDQFVLKTTHGSSQNIICKDKKNLDINKTKAKFKKWEKVCLYKIFKEWAYKDVTPRIICEEFIGLNNNVPNDYKFYCFNGKIGFIQVNKERFSNNHTETFFNENWEMLDFNYGVEQSTSMIEKPENFLEMKEIVRVLAKEHKFIRVDLYNVNNKIYFGELTFYPASGLEFMNPESLERTFGDMLDLS